MDFTIEPETDNFILEDIVQYTVSSHHNSSGTSAQPFLQPAKEVSPPPVLTRSDDHRNTWENDYIAFDEYYNEPIGRSFGNCEIPFVTS